MIVFAFFFSGIFSILEIVLPYLFLITYFNRVVSCHVSIFYSGEGNWKINAIRWNWNFKIFSVIRPEGRLKVEWNEEVK